MSRNKYYEIFLDEDNKITPESITYFTSKHIYNELSKKDTVKNVVLSDYSHNYLSRFERLINSCDCVLGFVNAPSLQQLMIKECLNERTDVDAYDINRKFLYQSLTDMGFECVKPEGAFYLFVKSPVADEKAFVAEAKKHHLLLVPATSFGCPGYVRIAYCVSYDMIKRSMPAFKALAETYFK